MSVFLSALLLFNLMKSALSHIEEVDKLEQALPDNPPNQMSTKEMADGVKDLLNELIKNSLVVDVQPCQVMRTNTLSENRKGGEDININPREKKEIPVYYIFYPRRPSSLQ